MKDPRNISEFTSNRKPPPEPSSKSEKELYWAQQIAEMFSEKEQKDKAGEVVGYCIEEGYDLLDIFRALVVLNSAYEREKLKVLNLQEKT